MICDVQVVEFAKSIPGERVDSGFDENLIQYRSIRFRFPSSLFDLPSNIFESRDASSLGGIVSQSFLHL